MWLGPTSDSQDPLSAGLSPGFAARGTGMASSRATAAQRGQEVSKAGDIRSDQLAAHLKDIISEITLEVFESVRRELAEPGGRLNQRMSQMVDALQEKLTSLPMDLSYRGATGNAVHSACASPSGARRHAAASAQRAGYDWTSSRFISPRMEPSPLLHDSLEEENSETDLLFGEEEVAGAERDSPPGFGGKTKKTAMRSSHAVKITMRAEAKGLPPPLGLRYDPAHRLQKDTKTAIGAGAGACSLADASRSEVGLPSFGLKATATKGPAAKPSSAALALAPTITMTTEDLDKATRVEPSACSAASTQNQLSHQQPKPQSSTHPQQPQPPDPLQPQQQVATTANAAASAKLTAPAAEPLPPPKSGAPPSQASSSAVASSKETSSKEGSSSKRAASAKASSGKDASSDDDETSEPSPSHGHHHHHDGGDEDFESF